MSGAGSPLWYLSRGSGVVLLVLVDLVIIGGVLTRAGVRPRGVPRFVVAGLHRNGALLALALLAVHVGTAIIDPYVSIGWAAAVLPFTSGYHPFRLGLGALALDILLALVVTSLLRGHLSRRAWRVVHWSAYAMWPLALAHGFAQGPDVTGGLLFTLTAGTSAAAATTLAWRMIAVRRWDPQTYRPAADTTLVEASR